MWILLYSNNCRLKLQVRLLNLGCLLDEPILTMAGISSIQMEVVKVIQVLEGGSMLRRDDGSVVFALADFYGDTTNTKAEATTLLQGLQQ